MRFTDKTALVTGAGGGIGRATALALAAEGASVVAADIHAEGAAETVRLIGEAGGTALAVQCDVAQEDSARVAVRTAVERFGGLDYLCSSAGIQTYGKVDDTDLDTWNRTFDVNVKGIYLMARFAIPEIRRRGGGAVVNVASVQGFSGSQEGVAAYAASKAATIALSRSMGLDHAREGIRVNCVCPGSVDTPMLRFGAANYAKDGDIQAVLDGWGEFHPVGRVGRADEVAALIVFLLSDQSSFITGAVIPIDGGLTTKLI